VPLTVREIENAKPIGKPKRLWDRDGLYVEISPAGSKYWRMKYRFGGKERRLSLGVFPQISMKVARERTDAARKLLAESVDPGETRRAQKAATICKTENSFEVVAREWFGKFSSTWAESHSTRIIRRLERDVFPWIGGRPIVDITAPELLSVLRRIENRSLETAHRALRNSGQIFRYATATGRVTIDPTGGLRGALPPVKVDNFAATTEPNRFAEILRMLDGYKGTLTVRCALRFAPLVFARPGELRQAKWSDFDLNACEWHYIASKGKTPHVVPLSRQAMAILRELHPLTSQGSFVFPGARSKDRPMSDNAILAAMRYL